MPLENYVLGKVIGKGSYGQVSLARHKRDKKQVKQSASLSQCARLIVGPPHVYLTVYSIPCSTTKSTGIVHKTVSCSRAFDCLTIPFICIKS